MILPVELTEVSLEVVSVAGLTVTAEICKLIVTNIREYKPIIDCEVIVI